MADDLKLIKSKIVNEDKIMNILEALGCGHIKEEQGGSIFTAQLPDKFNSSNKRAVQVRNNESLSCSIRNRADFKGDIFSLVSYIEYDKRRDDITKGLYESKKFICETLGWNHFLSGGNKKETIDYLASMKAILKKGTKKREIIPNPPLAEGIMENFLSFPSKDWLDEGIGLLTQKIYDVRFDLQTHRIVFPIKNRFGKIVGVKGRLIDKKDINDYNPKYMYVYRCNMSQEWFNLDKALVSIKSKKEVIIVESEKSCMKFYEHGIYNTLAIGSSDISTEQRDIILSLGYDVEIVLAYDSDKTASEVKEQADKFENRNVRAVFDNKKILPDKTAPIDLGLEIWNDLYENSCFDITYRDE